MNAPISKPALTEYAHLLQGAWAETGIANHHLFTSGELIVFRRWQGLSDTAKQLFGRLIFRVPRARVWAHFELPLKFGNEICSAGLAEWSHLALPVPKLASYFTKGELTVILKAHGDGISGSKTVLQLRAMQHPASLRDIPRFSLRHRSLFNRLLRMHLGRAHRWTEPWELQGIGKRNYWTGPRSQALPLYFGRRQLLSAERAWAVERCQTASWSSIWPDALDAFAKESTAPRHRLSPAQSWRQTVRRHLTRKDSDQNTVPFERLLNAISTNEPKAVATLLPAVVEHLISTHSGRRALTLVEKFEHGLPLHLRIALRPTHKRLSRHLGHNPLPPLVLKPAPVRRIRLRSVPAQPRGSRRPCYQVGQCVGTAEEAVIEAIQLSGRTAVFAENRLWQHLFTGLFADILMLPVEGMLTGPAQSRALDYGVSAFHQRRRSEIHTRLNQIKNGCARDVIRKNLEMFAGNQLGSVTVGAWPTERLDTIAQFLPDPFLAHCLGYLIAERQPSFSGFPDLLLYPSSLNPDSPSVLPSAIPSRLPKDHLWIEVKGPNDRAHAGQKAWHHHFLDWGEPVEIWELRPSLVTQSQ